ASQGDEAVWDVCLLVEAKASADAATKDFPRLLKGLEILAEASSDSDYAFSTREGSIRISGASLCALSSHEAELKKFVMYCCDEITEGTPRLLSAASRMQLLSAPASLDFASMLSDRLLAGKLKAEI